MLNAKNVAATIAVKDLDSAKEFYQEKLGFKPQETDDENYVSFKSGETSFLIYQSAFAGGYKATVATWAVGDEVDDIVKTLKSKGIAFEHYEMPDTKLEGDVHVIGDMRNAWFKDPDGNILCLVNA